MTGSAGIEAAFRGQLGNFVLDVAFTTPGRGVTVLFGPSGCGKTTTLRCVAGLQKLAGRCVVGDAIWQDDRVFLPTHRRPIGYVFQEASLFAHMTVRKNLLYATAGRPVAAAPGSVGFDETVDLLGLSMLLDRAPGKLSGGERQRVAIGRALLAQPRLLLMDEPLSALDRPTQEEIMPFLERLHAALALPVLLVTHDLAMVERLADHVLLIEAGRITASGPLQQIQSDPALPLALRRDAAVSLDATVTDLDAAYGLMTLAVAGGMFRVPAAELRPVGAKLRIRIAAGDVSLTRHKPEATTILNIQPARIVAATASGTHQMTVVLALGPDGDGARILARVTRFSWERLQLAEGAAVHVQVKSVALARRD